MAYYDGELLKQNFGKALNEFEELNVPISEVAIKIGQVIRDTPTADVEEVVRCRDCAIPHNKWTGCPKLNGLVPPPDFFCSYGERRKETKERF